MEVKSFANPQPKVKYTCDLVYLLVYPSAPISQLEWTKIISKFLNKNALNLMTELLDKFESGYSYTEAGLIKENIKIDSSV